MASVNGSGGGGSSRNGSFPCMPMVGWIQWSSQAFSFLFSPPPPPLSLNRCVVLLPAMAVYSATMDVVCLSFPDFPHIQLIICIHSKFHFNLGWQYSHVTPMPEVEAGGIGTFYVKGITLETLSTPSKEEQ